LAQQKAIVLGHYEKMLEQFGRLAGVRLARKHLSWYSRGLPGSAEFRANMNRLPDAEAVFAALDAFYDPLIERGVSRAPAENDSGANRPGANDPEMGEEVLEAA
jgi:tRNA-dihydrouridine synthase B